VKAESSLETTGSLAPVYREEGIQDWEGLSKSERDLDFLNETMRTDQIQSIITRIEMVVQDLIQTASGDDAQRLKRSMRAFKSALAWGKGVLDHMAHAGPLQQNPDGHPRRQAVRKVVRPPDR
jgi:hypothetical protein